jgi:hypothetical protein
VSKASCPNCGEPVEPRQLVCLNCGARVALRERTPLAREPASALAAVILSVIVVGAGLFGFAISELTSGEGGDGDGGSPPATEQTSAATPEAGGGQRQSQKSAGGGESQAPAVVSGEQQGTTPRQVGVPGWPKGLTAHTVVLVTSSDRPAALRVAREARKSGLEAGLLPSDPYNLGTGLWIVYSGQFTTREGAARQASELAGRYPGAYPQLIQRSQ